MTGLASVLSKANKTSLLMQKKSGPTQRGPEECHLQWARELMGHQ